MVNKGWEEDLKVRINEDCKFKIKSANARVVVEVHTKRKRRMHARRQSVQASIRKVKQWPVCFVPLVLMFSSIFSTRLLSD